MPPNPRRIAPRALTPDNPVVSYPTPNISDLMVVQDVDTRVPGYVALEYGDLHPDQVTYPGLKLVFQQPLDQDANFMWVRRIYAKDRADQDEYNYAIKFSANDPGYPIYVRTYILPRADYEPLDLGAIDPEYPTATLVNEEVQRIKSNSTSDANEELLDSLFVKVIRIYETIPGPVIGAKRVYNERGDLETVVKQTVDADAAPSADGLLVTAAMVEQEDASKGLKTTSTVTSHSTLRTKKRGNADLIPAKFRAAQVTEATDDIVAPSTSPEVPDGTIVESQVQQTSATKAKKVTVSLTGSVSPLSGKRYTPQGQVANVSETLISTGGSDDTITPSATTIEASIEALGNGKSVKTVAEVSSVFGEQTFSTERPDVTPEKFRALVPAVIESVVAAGTAATPTLGSGDLSKTEEQITVHKKRTRSTKRTLTSSASLVGHQTGIWGVEPVTETLEPDGGDVLGAAGKKEERLERLGNGHSVRRQVNFGTGVTLKEIRTDEQTGIRLLLEKTLVPAGTVPPPNSLVTKTFYEVQPIDAWNSIQIKTTVDISSLPAPETFHTTSRFTFPDVLEEVGVVWQTSSQTATSSTGVNSPNSVGDSDSWRVDAEAQADAKGGGVVYTKIRRGYSGPVRAQVTRTYSTTAPTTSPAITLITPVIGTVTITGKNVGGRGRSTLSGNGKRAAQSGSGTSTDVTIHGSRTQIGPFVHSGPSLVGGTFTEVSPSANASTGTVPAGNAPAASATASATATATLHLPSSTTPPTSGSSYVADATVEKWRFGIWVTTTTTIYHP